jgi:hypothetical protein
MSLIGNLKKSFKKLNGTYRYLKKINRHIELFHDLARVFSFKKTVSKKLKYCREMSGYFFAPQRELRWQSKKGLYVSEFLQIIDNRESPADHSAYFKQE